MKKVTKRKSFKPELWILVAGLLVIVLFVIYLYLAQYSRETHVIEPVACTMDAKICPDGSAVGRIAPNCEFAKCPGE